MILNDKKKAVSVILSKMKKDGGTTEVHVMPEEGEHNEYTAFAEDILHAVEKKSVQSLASCLKAFHEMIMEEDEEQDMMGE